MLARFPFRGGKDLYDWSDNNHISHTVNFDNNPAPVGARGNHELPEVIWRMGTYSRITDLAFREHPLYGPDRDRRIIKSAKE